MDRCIYIIVKINKSFLQIYAPTSQHPDEKLEQSVKKTSITILGGDFNAKIGNKDDEGTYGFGIGNKKRNTLANVAANETGSTKNGVVTKRNAS